VTAGATEASIAGVVFDLDGILIDSEHLWEEAWQAFAAEHGARWQPSDTAAVQGMSAPEWSRYLAAASGVAEQQDAALDSCVEYMIGSLRAGRAQMLEGARELLEGVSALVPTALATSAPRRVIAAVLEQHSLGALFVATVSSEEVARGKPSPDVYLEAISRLGVAPQNGLAIEDSSNGIRSAYVAGLAVVAIPNRIYPPKPDAAALAAYVAADHHDALEHVLARLPKGSS
jgi:HAD superfamily hydrolase (TIGR01509 family)